MKHASSKRKGLNWRYDNQLAVTEIGFLHYALPQNMIRHHENLIFGIDSVSCHPIAGWVLQKVDINLLVLLEDF